MNLRKLVRDEVFADDEDVQEACHELKRRFHDDLVEMERDFDRATINHAIRMLRREYSTKRYVNPYPLPDHVFFDLVDQAAGHRFRVGDMSPEEAADAYVENFELDEFEAMGIYEMMEEWGDRWLYAAVDQVLSDVVIEDRNAYADAIFDRVYSEIERELEE